MKENKKIHIQWVRSGIGFPRAQKTRVKSLGLGKLNRVVERPDTPQMRGLVESIPHLVEIVDAPAIPAWMSVPEVTILPPDPAAAPPPKPARKPKPVEVAEEAEPEKAEAKAKPEKAAAHAEHAKKEKKPAKAAAKSKKDEKEKKSKAAKAKPAKKTKK